VKSILLSTAALLGFATVAGAADLPARTPPPPVVAVAPVFTWTGFYAGIHGGYISNDSEARLIGDGAGLLAGAGTAGAIPTRRGLDSDGFAFGGQVGYNVQFGQFVAGIEADIAYTDVGRRRSITLGPVVGFPVATTTTLGSDVEYLGTVRGRLGVAVDQLLFFGPTYIFVTGGLAYGGVDNRVRIAAPFAADVVGGRSDTELGYTLGFGTESRLTQNISLVSDTLYYDLGRQTVTATNAAGTASASYRFQNDGWLSRIGLNFRF
jgi:outer membrane immunogenic protein